MYPQFWMVAPPLVAPYKSLLAYHSERLRQACLLTRPANLTTVLCELATGTCAAAISGGPLGHAVGAQL